MSINQKSIEKDLPSDFILSQGIDMQSGNDIKRSLVLNPVEREKFFSTRKSILSLLQTEPLNPSIEEDIKSFKDTEHRARVGEYFITPELLGSMLAMDIQKYHLRNVAFESKAEIKPAATRSSINTLAQIEHDVNLVHEASQHPDFKNTPYGVSNVFLINNNFEALIERLKSLKLKKGESAKIILAYDIHAAAFYVKNCAGKLKAYISDSQGANYISRTIASYLKSFVDKNMEIVIGPHIQNDHYTCFTFAKKSAVYFIKHGDEIFPYLEKIDSTLKDSGKDYKELSVNNLMPALLKFIQATPTLATESLNTLVSHQKQLTLQAYLAENKKEYTLTKEKKDPWGRSTDEKEAVKKQYNLTGIKKRYHYFAQLDDPMSLPVTQASVTHAIRSIYTAPKLSLVFNTCEELYEHFKNPKVVLTNPVMIESYKDLMRNNRNFQQTFNDFGSEFTGEWNRLAKIILIDYALIGSFSNPRSLCYSAREAVYELQDKFPNAKVLIAELQKSKEQSGIGFYWFMINLKPKSAEDLVAVEKETGTFVPLESHPVQPIETCIQPKLEVVKVMESTPTPMIQTAPEFKKSPLVAGSIIQPKDSSKRASGEEKLEHKANKNPKRLCCRML